MTIRDFLVLIIIFIIASKYPQETCCEECETLRSQIMKILTCLVIRVLTMQGRKQIGVALDHSCLLYPEKGRRV